MEKISVAERLEDEQLEELLKEGLFSTT